MTKPQRTSKRLMGTLYPNCMTGSHGIECNIYNWLFPIKQGKYKEPVERIRELTAEGRNDEATAIKK